MMLSQFQRPSIRRIMKRNLYQHKNIISSTYFTSHSICLDQITLPSPCAISPNLRSYNDTSQMRRYSSFNYNNTSIPNATYTIYAPSYAQYPLQLKLLQTRLFSSNIGSGNRRNQDPDMRVCQSIEELTQMAHEHISTMSPRGMSAYWTLVSKLLKKSRLEKVQNIGQMNHHLEDILGHTLQDINAFGYRDLSTVAVGLAKIIKNVGGIDGKRIPRYGTPQRVLYDLIIGDNSSNKEFIFKVLAEPSMIILHKFDARCLSNLIYAYGLADYVIKFEDGSTLFDVFAEVVIPNLHTFNGQDLSNMLWAYANVKLPNSQLFEQAGDSIVATNNLNEFWPQALSNIVWAYATAEEPHPKLFKKIADHIVRLESLDRFDPQALSNIIWSFATAEEPHPQLFMKVAEHIARLDNLKSFNGQNLSNTVWAFATAGESHPNLFKKMADHIVTLGSLRQFDEQALSNIVWAYATLDEQHPHLFKKVADHIVAFPSLNKFKPQALKDIPWAIATVGESHPQLFKKLADEAIKRQHEFKPQELANFLWAYATNGQIDEHLFSSLVPSIIANLDKYTAQGLANVAWSYSVADVDAPSVFNNDFIDACLNCLKKENDFISEELTQLHQWHLWQEEIKSDISLPSSLQKRCYEAFISQEIKQSKLQDDVVSILSSMLQPQEEVLLKSGYRIDAAVEVDGKQIAVEVDGPSHFIGKSREPNGSTILKHRQVATLDGMPVVSVPYWDWNMLKKDSKKKEQYLRHSLGLE